MSDTTRTVEVLDADTQRERLETLADAVIPESVEWVKELRRYRVYQGRDAEYFRKARLGLGIIGSAVRLCATIENSRSNDLIAHRLLSGDGEPVKQIEEAKAS